MKLIIVEGADLSGKTTLIGALKERFKNDSDMFFGRLAPPANWPTRGTAFTYWQDRIKVMLSNRELTNDSVIMLDRSFLGNYIYGNLKRDQLVLPMEDVKKLFKWLGSLFEEVLLIQLQITELELDRRLEKRAEDYVTKEEILEIQQEYKKALLHLSQSNIKNLRVFFETVDLETAKAVKNILTLI